MTKGYYDRAIQQTLLWMNGVSRHNWIDGECCPDFSCCYPDMFTEDPTTRRERTAKILDKLNKRRKENGYI